MNAEIITIGDELLIGQTIDTNSAWIAQQLGARGIWISRRTAIGDIASEITTAINEAFSRVDLVLVTGGLGPTKDDITKKTLCEYFGCGYRTDEKVIEQLKSFFEKRNRQLMDVNRQQADVPEICETLYNEMGTAPGMWFDHNGKVLVSMPGVPYEMKHIMETGVFPRLPNRFALPAIIHRNLTVINIPESQLSAQMDEAEKALPENMKLAYLPGLNIIRLRLTARGNDLKELEQEILPHWQAIAKVAAPFTLAEKDTTPVLELFEHLIQQKLSIAFAESCTGGNLAHEFTLIPGASECFLGSVTSYANSAKTGVLGVNEGTLAQTGAVSAETVDEMLSGAMKLFGADCVIATSGIAGPTGGTDSKPVGLVYIGVAFKNSRTVKKWHFFGTREHIIQRATNTAFHMLLQLIRGEEM